MSVAWSDAARACLHMPAAPWQLVREGQSSTRKVHISDSVAQGGAFRAQTLPQLIHAGVRIAQFTAESVLSPRS